MARTPKLASALLLVVAVTVVRAQEPSDRQIAQERRQAETDLPYLTDVLDLQPGMTVADVGSGGGAMTVVLGKWIGSGHVFATDITEHALRQTREYAQREGLTNVTVIEGAAASTNLPAACCDAIFLRHVYHHIIDIDAFNRSLHASLKPGGRLAIIDFVPEKGSRLPNGVPANREGHGIPTAVVASEVAAPGLTHVKTIEKFPPIEKSGTFLVLFRKP